MNTLAFMDKCATHGITVFGQYYREDGLYVGCLACHQLEAEEAQSHEAAEH